MTLDTGESGTDISGDAFSRRAVRARDSDLGIATARRDGREAERPAGEEDVRVGGDLSGGRGGKSRVLWEVHPGFRSGKRGGTDSLHPPPWCVSRPSHQLDGSRSCH